MKIEDMTPEQMRDALRRTREVAIRAAQEQGWCDNGLNEALEEIGLDPKGTGAQTTFTFQITVEHEPGQISPQELRDDLVGVINHASQDDDWADDYTWSPAVVQNYITVLEAKPKEA